MTRVSVFLAACALLSTGALADEWHKQYTVSGSPEISVSTGDGNVELHPGAPGSIQAQVTTKGYRIAEDDLRIIERQSGNRVEIELKFPQRSWTFGVASRRSVRVELTVPPELRAEIHTGDGSITARGVGGDLRLNTGDGAIQLSDAEGALQARTGDGRIRAQGRFERVSLRTGDGSIELDAAPGSRVAEPWKINTGDGSVRVRVPDDMRYDVDLQTGDGSMSVSPPVSSSTKSEHHYRGQVAGGGFPITIVTGDGSIRLENRGQ